MTTFIFIITVAATERYTRSYSGGLGNHWFYSIHPRTSFPCILEHFFSLLHHICGQHSTVPSIFAITQTSPWWWKICPRTWRSKRWPCTSAICWARQSRRWKSGKKKDNDTKVCTENNNLDTPTNKTASHNLFWVHEEKRPPVQESAENRSIISSRAKYRCFRWQDHSCHDIAVCALAQLHVSADAHIVYGVSFCQVSAVNSLPSFNSNCLVLEK